MSSKKVVPDVKMKTAQSRKRNNRRNPRKSSINSSEVLPENGDGRNKKGKRLKGDELKGDGEEEEAQDGMFLQEEADLYEGMLQLFPPIELDCSPAEHPVVPGTPVTLHGVILHETSAGLIVLNVRWRRRVFSGALIDIEKNRCSAQQMRPDPPSMCDGAKFKPLKALDFSAAGETAVKPRESPAGNASAHAKLNGKYVKAAGKCGKSLMAPLEPLATVKCEENAKRSSKPVEQPYIECHEPNCGKRYKHINGLKYHRRTVHPAKAEDGLGKENKNDALEGDHLSDADVDAEDKADSETSDDASKNKAAEETAKRPCRKGQSNEDESIWDQDGSSENTEKEELTENERRIEKLRIEARKASAALQHIIKLEQGFERRPDEASDPELGADRRDNVEQQATSSRPRLHDSLAVKGDQEGVVTVAIKQEVCNQKDEVTSPIRRDVCDQTGVVTFAIKQEVCDEEDEVTSPFQRDVCDQTGVTTFPIKQEVCDEEDEVTSPFQREVCNTSGKPFNGGESNFFATELYNRVDSSAGMPCEDAKGLAPETGDRFTSGLDVRTPATSNRLCPSAVNYSQYSPTLGQLNPQEITNSMCTALAPANSYETASAHGSSTGVALPGLAVTATSPSAVKDKLHLCPKRSLEIQHVHKALLPDGDSAGLSSVLPRHSEAIAGFSCQPGHEVVPPSDEERSGSGSPNWPLVGCDKFTAVDRSLERLKVEDEGTVLIKDDVLRNPFGRGIDPVEAVSEHRGPLDKLGKMHSFLASVALVTSQSPPGMGLHASCRPSLGDSPAASEMQCKLPAGYPGEAGNPHHFSPQLLGVLSPGSRRNVNEPPMSVDAAYETKIYSKPVVEKKPSFGVEAFVVPSESSTNSPVAKVPVFLQPNISAGRPICLPAASQNVASSVVVSDAFVGSIDQELGSLFARSLQGKVSMEHLPMLPHTNPNVNSLLARSAEPFREVPRNVTFGTSGNSLRINPPVGGGEERVQIGARTWTPPEVFPKTASSTAEASPKAAAGPGMSKFVVSSPESCCSTSLVGLSVLQTSVVPAMSNAPVALAVGKLPSKRPGHPVLIAPAPGLPSPLPLVGLVAGVRASVADLTSGSSTSATDSDKSQPQVSRFTLTSDNRLVPSPVENRGRPRKVRVEKTQQIPIGTAQDIERSRGPAEAALVRKRASSPVSRPSVIQPSSHVASPTGSAALSPPDKKAKPDVPVWTDLHRDTTRLADMHSPEGCERANLMSDSRHVTDPRQQQQQLQEGFRAFGSSPVNFAGSSQVAASAHLSSPPGRLTSPRGSEISRPQHSLPGPLASPRLSRASPMSSPYQNIFTATSRMEDVKFGEVADSSRKDLVKLMMDITSGSAVSDHARSPNQRPAIPSRHSFLPHSSASPVGHFKASLYAGESNRDNSNREQSFSHFLFPKADGDLKSPVQRVPDLLRNPARPHAEPIPVFHGPRFSGTHGNMTGFHSRPDFHQSERSLFERRMGSDDRIDTRQPTLHDSRYALHPPVGHHRERFPSLAGNSGNIVPSAPAHHSTNLVLGRADGAIIRPLNFESRQMDKR